MYNSIIIEANFSQLNFLTSDDENCINFSLNAFSSSLYISILCITIFFPFKFCDAPKRLCAIICNIYNCSLVKSTWDKRMYEWNILKYRWWHCLQACSRYGSWLRIDDNWMDMTWHTNCNIEYMNNRLPQLALSPVWRVGRFRHCVLFPPMLVLHDQPCAYYCCHLIRPTVFSYADVDVDRLAVGERETWWILFGTIFNVVDDSQQAETAWNMRKKQT